MIRDAVSCTSCCNCLCDELDDTASLLDLLLSLGADVASADNNGDSGETALAEDLGVAVVEEVENGCVSALVGEVLVTLLGGDERPELVQVCGMLILRGPGCVNRTRLTDHGLPEKVLHLVEVTHTDLSEVTGVVLVNVGAVVVLTTLYAMLAAALAYPGQDKTYGHTTTTGMLPVLSDTSVTGRNIYMPVSLGRLPRCLFPIPATRIPSLPSPKAMTLTCLHQFGAEERSEVGNGVAFVESNVVQRTAAVLASLGQSGRHVDFRCEVSCERLKVRTVRLFCSSGWRS